MILIFGTTGMFTAGSVSDWLLSRGTKEAPMTVTFYSAVFAFLPATLAPLVANPYLALGLIAPASFFLSFFVGLGPSALQQITPNQMRGQLIAVYLFVNNFLGLGLGPTLIASVTQYGFQDDRAVGKSLAICVGAAGILAILVLRTAARRMRRHLE